MLVSTVIAFVLSVAPEPVFPADAKMERLWSEGEFTEGGAMDAEGGILFSDIGDRIMRFDPKTGKVSTFRDPSGRANGMIFLPDGRLVVAEGADRGGKRRVSVTGKDGSVKTLADSFEGKRFNSPNDVAVDAKGRVYVSDPRYVGDEPRELEDEAVYRIDGDGSVHRVETTATRPNGLAVSPDGKTLYVSDNGPKRRALLAVPLTPEGDAKGKPKVLKNFGNGRGIDGLTVSTDGRIVTAAGGGKLSGVYVYETDGVPVGFVGTPEPPTNVEFGGAEGKTLYVTAGKSLYRIETNLRGYRVVPEGR